MLPLVPGDLLDEPLRPVDAGVVHEHVDPREALEAQADEPLHRLGLRDVRRGRLDRAGVRRDRLELHPGAVEGARVASRRRAPAPRRRRYARAISSPSPWLPPVTIAVLPARTPVTLGLRVPTRMYRTPSAPAERLEEKAVRVDDVRCPHRRPRGARGSTVAVCGPVGLDHDRRGVLGRLERCRAQREDPGEVVRNDANRRVVRFHVGPGAGELPAELDRARTAQGVRPLLVDEAPDADDLAVEPAVARVDERLDRPPAHRLCSSLLARTAPRSCVGDALALADLRQVLDVTGQRSACEGAARPEVRTGADPALGLEPSLDLGRVGTDALRDACKLVRERDRQREKGVDAVLHELRRLDAHPLDPVGERPEQLLDAAAVAVGPDPDDDPVRLRERGDRVAEPQVLRRVGEACAGAARAARAAASSRREAATRSGSRRPGRRRRRAPAPAPPRTRRRRDRPRRRACRRRSRRRPRRAVPARRSVVKLSEPAASSRRTSSASPGSSTGRTPLPRPATTASSSSNATTR